MKRIEINIGDKFGSWTVLDPDIPSKHGSRYIKCKCGCGLIKDVLLSRLRTCTSPSCRSCAVRKRTHKLPIGSKYKNFTVLDGPFYENGKATYKVSCSCGNKLFKMPIELMKINKYFHCEKCTAPNRAKNVTYMNGRVGDVTKTMFTKFKRSAESRGLIFDVTISDLWNKYISQDKKCGITGDHIEHVSIASLDRIDSTIGYTVDNIQWTTKQANLSKHILSMSDLYVFCFKVLSNAHPDMIALIEPLKNEFKERGWC